MKFQRQFFQIVKRVRHCGLWLAAMALSFDPSLAWAQAQSKAPADLSLLPGPMIVTPPGGLKVQTAKPTTIWPWERTGETPDPAIRFGRLENGMRYAIQRDDNKEGEVALRFRIHVGSAFEEDHQLGYAHFLEHMAFNGSKNVPEGELIKRMERLGAAFGRHVNASTSTNETIYRFDLPKADEGRLELALDLFRETADRLTLAQDAIDREKGIVSNEQVSRASPMADRFSERQKLFYPRVRHTHRSPIGTIASIEATTSASLRAFYERWYRPERAILVVVGVIDVDATEAMIKERFASWKPALNEPNPPDPSEGQWEENKLAVSIDRSNTQPEEFVIEAERPDPRLFERGSREEESIRQSVRMLTFNIVNRRLSLAVKQGDPSPLLSASYGGPFAGPNNQPGMGWRAQFDFVPRNGDWKGGLKAIALEMRRILQDGISQEERDRAIAQWTRDRPSSELPDFFEGAQGRAESILRALTYNWTPMAKQDRATRRAQLLREFERITVALLNEELRIYWQGVQPRFLITTQDPSVTEASVLALWREILAAPIPPRQVVKPVRLQPANLGPAGKLAGRWREPGLDADFVRFENGLTLVVKPNPTKVTDPAQSKRPGQVALRVQISAGWLAFGDSDNLWAGLAEREWEVGGFGNLKASDISEAFRESALNPIDRDIGLVRTSLSTEALLTHFNETLDVVLAQIVSPKLGRESAQFYADRLKQYLALRQLTAQDVLSQKRSSLYQTGSPLFAARTPEELLQAVLKVDAAQANERLLTILKDAPINVIVAGDIDLDTAIKVVESRFGALPKRRGLDSGIAVAHNWRLTDGGGPMQTFHHGGKEDQALVHVAWQIQNIEKGPDAFRLDLLSEIFQVRANDVIREAYGQSYSPSVGTTRLPGYGNHVVLAVTAIVLPKDVESVESHIRAIAKDLATHGPTEDEIARARAPLLANKIRDCETNRCWVSTISDALIKRDIGEREARPWQDGLDSAPTMRTLTRQDLQALAESYFVDSRLIRAQVLPGAKQRESGAE